jgi:prevent-host-death family protein
MKTKLISNYIPALTARTQLGQILKRVRQHNERFVVGRRGEAQAVIMSVEDYLKNFAAEAPALKKVQRTADKMGTKNLSDKTIREEIKRYRREQRVRNA